MIIGFVFVCIEYSLFVAFFFVAKSCLKKILLFHDYLISYRLTPRSRIMRKHLPKMSMVLEEESNLEQSMMVSQHMVASMSNISQMYAQNQSRSKFRYKEATSVVETANGQLVMPSDEGKEESSSSSSEEIDEDNAMKDLMKLEGARDFMSRMESKSIITKSMSIDIGKMPLSPNATTDMAMPKLRNSMNYDHGLASGGIATGMPSADSRGRNMTLVDRKTGSTGN